MKSLNKQTKKKLLMLVLSNQFSHYLGYQSYEKYYFFAQIYLDVFYLVTL